MTVAITPDLNAARLAGVLTFLDAGTDPARLRVYAGDRPAAVGDAPDGDLLAEIALTKPAGAVAAGVLTLTQAADGLVVASGIATWARLVAGDGATALDMDCSDMAGTGDVKLASTQLYLGGAARIVSAVLA